MEIKELEKEFREKIGHEISLIQEGNSRYRIFTPFQFEDGDDFDIVLKQNPDGKYFLTDEGHTYMHLSYDLDMESLEQGTRQKIITAVLNSFSVEDKNGELICDIKEKEFGNALFSYIQALVKISDVSYLSRERVRSTFIEDFKIFISSNISKERVEFNHVIKEHDPKGRYSVDCRVNNLVKPLFIFAVPSDDKCRDTMINVLQYERWNISFSPMVIFEDMEEMNRRVLSRLTDVVEKQFSSLYNNKDRIKNYVEKYMEEESL